MSYQNESLRELYERVARKKQLSAQLFDLQNQKGPLDEKVKALELVMKAEQADVDKLEHGSLAGFFYNVVGKKDDKLNKEREEAYAARVKYDAVVKEQAFVKEEILCCEEEIESLEGCEVQYQEAFAAALAEVKNAGTEKAEKIFAEEGKLLEIAGMKKELEEAMYEGRIAREMADSLWNKLDSAGGWATFDLLGGGLISDMVKHDKLREAQEFVENLQVQLRRFKTELADVTITADIQMTIDGFLHVADYIFDGLFVDWIVADKIENAQNQVWAVQNQIFTTMKALENLMNEAEAEEAVIKEKIEALVIG